MNPKPLSRLVRPPGVPSDAILRILRVPPEAAGQRVDVFLQTQLRGTSRTRTRAIVKKTGYRIDGKKLRGNERLRGEDRVVLWRPPLDERDAAQELPLLFEDDHLLVLDKPPLMAVHPTARHHHRTVIKLLEEQRPGQYLSLIHRLDRETSGVLLVAKTREADRAFKCALQQRSRTFRGSDSNNRRHGPTVLSAHPPSIPIEKHYLALTWGVPKSGCIDLPLEPDVDNALRVKMRVSPSGSGLESRTTITVRETRSNYALVDCQLHTGRQHQIRVHLAALGTPVVGDKLYGPDDRLLARAADGQLSEEDRVLLELPRHALHNHRYGLKHAITGEKLDFVSPLAEDLATFWELLAANRP